jgi:hypothetical protein
MPPGRPHKFTPDLQERYLTSLREGNLKFESARMVGVSPSTVRKLRKDDDEFAEAEAQAMAEAREGIEKILYGMALEGDLGAIDRWLKAHDSSTYGAKAALLVDATPAAVELGKADAMARVAELQRTLAERETRMRDILPSDDEDLGVIDAESTEILPDLPALPFSPIPDDELSEEAQAKVAALRTPHTSGGLSDDELGMYDEPEDDEPDTGFSI